MLKKIWRFAIKPKVFIPVGAVGIALAIWLVFLPPFQFYLYFTSVSGDEALPFAPPTTTAPATETPATMPSMRDEPSATTQPTTAPEGDGEMTAPQGGSETTEMTGEHGETTAAGSGGESREMTAEHGGMTATDGKNETAEGSEGNPEETATPGPIFHPVSDLVGADAIHRASGTVRVLEQGEQRWIRYEDINITNGPRLEVWLTTTLSSPHANPNNYVSLGPAKGTVGNFNYEIPSEVDLTKYRYVIHWCVPFRVLFNHAELRLN